MTIFINGIGNVQYTHITEYVSSFISKIYIEEINNLRAVLNKSITIAADYDRILDSMQDLARLARNGASDSQTPLARNFITLEMARALGLVFRSLQSAGIDLNPTVLTNDQKIRLVKTWQAMAGFGVDELLRNALTVNFNLDGATLQSYVELEYVKAGNDYISGKLVDLQQALSVTDSILGVLNVIQGISNLIGISPTEVFNWPPNVLKDIPQDARLHIAHLNAALSTAFILDNNSSTGTHFANEIKRQIGVAGFSPAVPEASAILNMGSIYKIAASAHFKQVLPAVTNLKPNTSTELLKANSTLIAKINFLSTQLGIKRSAVNSLSYFLDALSKTIKDYHTQFPTDWISRWILDKQDILTSNPDFINAGQIQNSLSQSIRASQSLNDTKKEEVRQYMFYFDQFYKSASDVLSKVSQIIERMGQQISR